MKESMQVERERSERIKHSGKVIPFLTKVTIRMGYVLLGTCVLPMDVFASEILEASLQQVKVGTLPLLAALGVGIAVAVGAVIAFLQLAAKGKEANEISPMTVIDNELLEEDVEEWDGEGSTLNSEFEDNPITDYTIPITRLLTYPDHVEVASEGEPRICGVEGEHSGYCYRISNRRLSFGRDPAQCAILFPYESGLISRLHCTLSFIEESHTFMLEDHGSSNGTFLADGQRLEPGKGYELRAGQRFSLSGSEHWFEVKDGN